MPVGSSSMWTRFGLSAVAAAVLVTGCSRKYYRNSADREVESVITEKNCNPIWGVENWHVYPDPKARFAETGNSDRPPMPPDDPAARCLAPNPQKPHKAGIGNPDGNIYLQQIAAWDGENRAILPSTAGEVQVIPGLVAAPPEPNNSAEKALKTNEKPYLITLDQACELALFNSREYQDERENLFLAALPVTLERFAFAAQFFATEQLIRERTGSQTPEGYGQRWRSNSAIGVSRLFPTGALLIARLANQVIVNMSTQNGGPRVLTPSLISLDFTQPLLRDGGKAVTLEPLTQVERNLLYGIRGYARFRKEFYVSIAGGGDFGNNFNPGSPLAASGFAVTEGYMPNLLRTALLENEKQNVSYLESIRAFYRALQEGGDASQLQVDQIELDLLNSRANVLQQSQQLRDALDRFKIQLGVPTAVPLELDVSPFRPLVAQQKRFLDIVDQFESLRTLVNRSDLAIEPEKLRERLRQVVNEHPLTDKTNFRIEFATRWAKLEQFSDQGLTDFGTKMKADRKALQELKAAKVSKGETLGVEQLKQLDGLDRDLDMVYLEQSTRRLLARPWMLPGTDSKRVVAIRTAAFRDVASDFVVVMGEARNERLDAVRERWPTLPNLKLGDVDLLTEDLDRATAAASQAALENRFDLMNARARVVDSWRKIAVRANALLGVLNVQYHLDGNTPSINGKPFDFDQSRSRHQLILNGELPLVRQAERNEYRTSLIAFQRSRRTLQGTEDNILASVRSELRQLRFLAENYKIQQRSVELAYYQVENSLNVLQAPPRPVPAGQLGGGGSSTSDSGSQAALTRQLLDAVRGLLQAQNRLYSVYQNYLITRMQLYRDLELLPLDARGVWTDEYFDPTGPAKTDPGADASRPPSLPAPRVLP